MSKKRMLENPELRQKGISIGAIMTGYVLLAVIGLIVVMHIFGNTMKEHDEELTATIDTLIAEKMNSSIDYMIESVDDVATVLSSQTINDYEELYNNLTTTVDTELYVSIGMIIEGDTTTPNIYATESEKYEMEKWGFIEEAKETQNVFMTEPYRQTSSGKLVFSMFAPLYQNDKRVGELFITYNLEEFQKLAQSDVLTDDVEIYLMNAYSDNVILCSGKDEFAIGNWSNTKLYKQDIDARHRKDYDKWELLMRMGADSASVRFSLYGESYTEVFKKIDSMNGWYVVARITNDALSDAMEEFRVITIIFGFILVLLSLVVFYVVWRRDQKEKHILENLSVHDSLTKLVNRRAFEYMAEDYLKNEAGKKEGSLIFVDVDYFKSVNDTFGHDIGDKVLVEFAQALTEVFDDNSIVSRYGGDEFVVLVKHIHSRNMIKNKLDVLKLMVTNIQDNDEVMKNSDFKLHYSAGVVDFPKYGKDLAKLTKCADEALYIVKERGRDGYGWYDEEE